MPPRPRGIAKPKNAKGTLQRLMKYLTPHKGRLILVACCILVSALVTATGTYLVVD